MYRFVAALLVAFGSLALGADTPPAKPAVAADQTTPRGAVKLFTQSIQSGDSAKVLACMKANSQLEEQYANGYVDVTIGMGKLRSAVKAKFGEDAAKAFGSDAGLAEIDAAKEEISGNTATVEVGGDKPVKLELVKDGDKWKIAVAKMIDGKKPEEIRKDIRNMQLIGKSAAETAGDVEQGKFKKASEVTTALTQKLSQAANER